jgi:hypothetical protein
LHKKKKKNPGNNLGRDRAGAATLYGKIQRKEDAAWEFSDLARDCPAAAMALPRGTKTVEK